MNIIEEDCWRKRKKRYIKPWGKKTLNVNLNGAFKNH